MIVRYETGTRPPWSGGRLQAPATFETDDVAAWNLVTNIRVGSLIRVETTLTGPLAPYKGVHARCRSGQLHMVMTERGYPPHQHTIDRVDIVQVTIIEEPSR